MLAVASRRFFLSSIGCNAKRCASTFTLSGIYPPVVTPFDPNTEAINYAKYETLLQHLDKFPLAGFVILGSNGEFPYLTREEKIDVVRNARKILGKDRVVIAGAGAESTRDTIALVKDMAAVGANAVLVYNPCYFKARMNTAAYINHFTKVADNSPVPVILYNVPANTSVDIPVDAVCELAKHSNIVGVKESGGDIIRISNICRLTSKLSKQFNVVAGSAGFLLPAMLVGAVGAISALANVLPAELVQLQFLFSEGRLKEAKELQMKIIAPNSAVTAQFGVPGLKNVLRVLRGVDTGVVRSPLMELTSAEAEKVLSVFRDAGFC